MLTKINNKGYAERFLKTYSLIQDANNQIIIENGLPSTWEWTKGGDIDNSKNYDIVDMYKKHFKVRLTCYYINSWSTSECTLHPELIKGLDNQRARNIYNGIDFWIGSAIVLEDETIINFSFHTNFDGTHWGYPSALVFCVDINGKAKPNKVGRDIFFLYLDTNTGKILPFISNESNHSLANTCDTTKGGQSCAYRIVTEGKMNY